MSIEMEYPECDYWANAFDILYFCCPRMDLISERVFYIVSENKDKMTPDATNRILDRISTTNGILLMLPENETIIFDIRDGLRMKCEFGVDSLYRATILKNDNIILELIRCLEK